MTREVDEDEYPELATAVKVAKHIMYADRGLRRWPDMRPTLVGADHGQREEWLDEATCKGLTLLDEGATEHDLYEGVASHMAATVRRPPAVSLDGVADARLVAPSAEESYFANGHASGSRRLYDLLADELTARQWDMVRTYVTCGSPTEAGILVGSTKANVLRAVRRAREILEGGGTSGEEQATIEERGKVA